MTGWVPAAVAGGAAFGVLGVGGALTRLGPWYFALRKPSWQPPGWLFAPAWSTIAVLTAWAGVLAWEHPGSTRWRALLIALFAVNGVLNILWSACFFAWRRPDWALVEVVPLWLSILALIATIAGHAPLGAVLLLPYLAWVGFAAVLNRRIVTLNHPFARPAGWSRIGAK